MWKKKKYSFYLPSGFWKEWRIWLPIILHVGILPNRNWIHNGDWINKNATVHGNTQCYCRKRVMETLSAILVHFLVRLKLFQNKVKTVMRVWTHLRPVLDSKQLCRRCSLQRNGAIQAEFKWRSPGGLNDSPVTHWHLEAPFWQHSRVCPWQTFLSFHVKMTVNSQIKQEQFGLF